MTQSKETINVLTIGVDTRKVALYRMAFKMCKAPACLIVDGNPEITPDLAIVDIDCLENQNLWINFRKHYPNLPVLITTISPPPDTLIPVLSKPVREEKLFALIQQVVSNASKFNLSTQQTAVVNTFVQNTIFRSKKDTLVITKPSTITEDTESSTITKDAKPSTITEDAKPSTITENYKEAPRHSLKSSTTPLRSLSHNIDIERFNPNHGLLGLLVNIRHDKISSMISISNRDSMLVFPEQNRVFMLYDMNLLCDFCKNPHILVNRRPLTKGEQSLCSDVQINDFTTILWQVALWTSQGRLVENIDLDARLRIHHWPNLTRLASIPNSFRISAFLVRTPANLPIIVHMLNIPVENVCDFIAASYSIGLLNVLRSESCTTETRPLKKDISSPQGGLLSRLLSKILRL